MPPPVELTVRLEAEIAPSTVALAFRMFIDAPVAEILPADEKSLPELLTVIALPEAVRLVLPVTEAAATCDMPPPVELTVRLEAEIVPNTVAFELTIVTFLPLAEMASAKLLPARFRIIIPVPLVLIFVVPETVRVPETCVIFPYGV